MRVFGSAEHGSGNFFRVHLGRNGFVAGCS
jgi:hypothetical protein